MSHSLRRGVRISVRLVASQQNAGDPLMLTKLVQLTDALRSKGGLHALVTWKPRSLASFRIVSSLLAEEVTFRTVIDGGANVGQFARAAHWAFPTARFYCFEPQPDVCDKLRHNLSDLRSLKVFQSALGSTDGEVEFHVNSFNQSSSVLRMLDKEGGIMAGTRETESLRVPCATLDALLADEVVDAPALLKLDLQGFELEALKGAPRILQLCSHVLVETVFSQAYHDEPLFQAVADYLGIAGFSFRRPLAFARDRHGTICQMDALFERSQPESAE
ncbi:MAG: FkbM family methyltransferase [Betaproteobacteria bacterium]